MPRPPAGYREIASAQVFETKPGRNMIWAPMSYANGYLIVRSQDQMKCLDLRTND